MRIKALESAAGEHMIRRGGEYDLPDHVAQDYIKAGFAVPVDSKRVVEHADETASVKIEKRKKK